MYSQSLEVCSLTVEPLGQRATAWKAPASTTMMTQDFSELGYDGRGSLVLATLNAWVRYTQVSSQPIQIFQAQAVPQKLAKE